MLGVLLKKKKMGRVNPGAWIYEPPPPPKIVGLKSCSIIVKYLKRIFVPKRLVREAFKKKKLRNFGHVAKFLDPSPP